MTECAGTSCGRSALFRYGSVLARPSSLPVTRIGRALSQHEGLSQRPSFSPGGRSVPGEYFNIGLCWSYEFVAFPQYILKPSLSASTFIDRFQDRSSERPRHHLPLVAGLHKDCHRFLPKMRKSSVQKYPLSKSSIPSSSSIARFANGKSCKSAVTWSH